MKHLQITTPCSFHKDLIFSCLNRWPSSASSISMSSVPLLPLGVHPRTGLDLVGTRRSRPIHLTTNVIALYLHLTCPPSFISDVRTCGRACALAASRCVRSLLTLTSHHAHARRWLAQMLMALLGSPGEMVVLL